MRTACLALAVLLGASAAPADEFKIIKLEQDVRNLERQVQTLERRVEELSSRLRRSGEYPAGPRGPGAEPSSSDWLVAANWDRIRPGMSELEVIQLLGRPASMRPVDGGRVLLYAMEIGSDGFLSGSVTIRDRQVVEVEKPALK